MARNITNTDILKEVKEVRKMQEAQADDIRSLKLWKQAEDAYKAALLQVRADEKTKNQDEASKQWLKILREIYPIIGILGALLYAVAASRGIH